MLNDTALFKKSMRCRCPKCDKAPLFKSTYSLDLQDKCANCGLDFSKNDSADGPAVLLIFILGFALVPLALMLEVALAPPLWVHALLWGAIALGLTLGTLKPIKSYVIALQYKHRPEDWED
jgi:uncharacterized protein (DUF983 family)